MDQQRDLEGIGALVTGASSGIGQAARGGVSIVSIASMAGQGGLACGAAYGTTKATLVSMPRSWAAEFSSSGIRVNAMERQCPPW